MVLHSHDTVQLLKTQVATITAMIDKNLQKTPNIIEWGPRKGRLIQLMFWGADVWGLAFKLCYTEEVSSSGSHTQ
jgi:hypothetical protein